MEIGPVEVPRTSYPGTAALRLERVDYVFNLILHFELKRFIVTGEGFHSWKSIQGKALPDAASGNGKRGSRGS
jgi:hypothetical protein